MLDDTIRPADRLVGLFAAPVVGYEVSGTPSVDWLLPAERRHVAGAVDLRQREFAGGRRCAREALAALGAPAGPLLVRAPRVCAWPPGFVGSITHTTGYCGVVACATTTYAGIGVDVEVRGRMRRELESLICTVSESRWLESLAPSSRADMATLLFSAKEAFYKCQFCLTGSWLGFQDARVEIGDATFRVVLLRKLPGLGGADAFVGAFRIEGSYVWAGIAMR